VKYFVVLFGASYNGVTVTGAMMIISMPGSHSRH